MTSTLISTTHGTLAFGMDYFSCQTCLGASLETPCLRQMNIVEPTTSGGG